jgi:hypothetical protein
MQRNAQVNLLLNAINRCKFKQLGMYKAEFEMLRRLAPISPERVVRDQNGNIKVFYIDKEKTIGILKNLYSFKSKEEAVNQVKDAADQH